MGIAAKDGLMATVWQGLWHDGWVRDGGIIYKNGYYRVAGRCHDVTKYGRGCRYTDDEEEWNGMQSWLGLYDTPARSRLYTLGEEEDDDGERERPGAKFRGPT